MTGIACPIDRTDDYCTDCRDGYELTSNNKCVPITCTCLNGTPLGDGKCLDPVLNGVLVQFHFLIVTNDEGYLGCFTFSTYPLPILVQPVILITIYLMITNVFVTNAFVTTGLLIYVPNMRLITVRHVMVVGI